MVGIVTAEQTANILRQDQREIGRPVQWTRAVVLCRRLVLAGKGRVRLDRSVVVLDPVRQQQRAPVLLLGILGERDRRRLVGDGVERPVQIVPTPRSVAVPAAAILKRCSSVPLGACIASLAAVTPPLLETLRLSLPVARTTSVLPAGTVTGQEQAGGGRKRRQRRPQPRRVLGRGALAAGDTVGVEQVGHAAGEAARGAVGEPFNPQTPTNTRGRRILRSLCEGAG